MPALFEKDQVGKKDSLAELISCVEVESTPLTSMIQKRAKPNQSKHHWQLKSYPRTGHKGIQDGKDAETFSHNPRKETWGISQKLWHLPAVSDLAEEAEVAGLPQGEMAEQIADSLVLLKRQQEMRICSNEECQEEDGLTKANETRGLFKWIQATAQDVLPVPEGYRTPAASIFTSTLAALTETAFKGLCRSSFKQRHGAHKLDAFLGVDCKAKFTEWNSYNDTVANKENVKSLVQNASDRSLISVVDRLVLDTGTVDLHLASFLYTDATTGEDTAYTHRSGLVLDMSKIGMAYTRKPRVTKLEYRGGGYKAIVDCILMLMVDNPLGQIKLQISADS